MKNILFNSFANIDDDLLDMTVKKIKRAKPRKIALRVTGFAAAAAAAVFAVNLAVSYVNKYKPPVASESGFYSSTSISEPSSSGTYSGASNSADNSGSSASSAANPSASSGSETSEPVPIRGFYDSVYKGDGNPAVIGTRLTYEDVMEIITSQASKDHDIYIDSFYLVETIRALPVEESKQLNGWGLICEGGTIYEVKIISDLISGEKVDRTEKILVSAGTPEWQDGGDPAYAPGERFTITLAKPIEGEDFLQTPGGYMFRYDAVTESGGAITLYSRVSEMDALGLPSSTEIDEYVITSTTNNPAYYTQKVSLDAVVEFLRSDWKAREVSRHFENNSSSAEQKAFYDDIFVGMALEGCGPRTTYDEVMDRLTSQSAKDHGIYIDSFYLVETVQALSIEGYDWDSNDSTIYEVKIIKDLISGEDINRTEKILISNGTPKWQYEYDPAYAPGEKFTVALGKPKEGKDYIEAPGSYMFKYDVPSDGSGYIYSRVSEMDKLNLPTSENIRETVVTSTTKNPAGYTQKVTLDAVVEFLRSDWKARGVSRHFDGTT